MIQAEVFSKEIKALEDAHDIPKQSAILRLNPFLDKHPFTKMLIIHEHKRHFHAGPQATLAAVRQNFWPCAGRDIVRHVIKRCVLCARCHPQPSTTLIG